MLVKQAIIGFIAMSLASVSLALAPSHPVKKVEKLKPGEVKAKTESPFAYLAPGTRLVNGEENLNEFYILGKHDPEPVKPKPAITDVKKLQIYKVQVYKVAIKKSTKSAETKVLGNKIRHKITINQMLKNHAKNKLHTHKNVRVAMLKKHKLR